MYLKSLSIIVFLCSITHLSAQGFNNFSGRNHPENKWQVAETQHFKLMYPQHLAGIEAEAASIAEASYETLSKNLGVQFKDKIEVYFSDEDEIANGFATPLGGYSCIWVDVNEFATVWTGEVKWLRKVLSHELSHLFTFEAIKSKSRLFSIGSFPRHWNEGLAQYQTERWDSERGDRWVRTAILEDRPNFEDGISGWNGRLLYAVGNSQLRYFATQYGDSSLTKLLAFRKKGSFGNFGKSFDFEEGFKKVVGKSYDSFNDEWRRFMNIYYNTMASRQESPDSLKGKRIAFAGQYLYDLQPSPTDSSAFAFIAQKSLSESYTFLGLKQGKTIQELALGAINEPFSWSPDGKMIAFSRNGFVTNGALVNDLFLVDLKRKTRRLTTNRRAVFPTFSPDGQHLAFVGVSGKSANVFVLNLETQQETRLTYFNGDVQINGLSWQPNGEMLAMSYFVADGRRFVALVDARNGQLTNLTDGSTDERNPIWSPDGKKLAVTSLKDETANVFIVDIETKKTERVTRLATGANVLAWTKADSLHANGSLILKVLTTKRADLAYRISADKRATELSANVPAKFSKWRTHEPPNKIPYTIAPQDSLIQKRYTYQPLKNVKKLLAYVIPFYTETDGILLTGAGTWSEPLGKHQFAVSGIISTKNFKNSDFLAQYTNNLFRPTLNFQYAQGAWFGEKLYPEVLKRLETSFSLPIDRFYKPFTQTTIAGYWQYQDRKPQFDENLFSVNFFEKTPRVSAIPDRGLPQAGQEMRGAFAMMRKFAQPYALNTLQPKKAYGIRNIWRGAMGVNGTNSQYIRSQLDGYFANNMLGGALFVYGNVQAQFGKSLSQDFVGISPNEGMSLGIATPVSTPLGNAFALGDALAVRGLNQTITGDRLAFGRMEYQTPIFDLQTRILGFVNLGATTFVGFADGAVVQNTSLNRTSSHIGYGGAIRNRISFGFVDVIHEVGRAFVGVNGEGKWYYRIQTALPF